MQSAKRYKGVGEKEDWMAYSKVCREIDVVVNREPYWPSPVDRPIVNRVDAIPL